MHNRILIVEDSAFHGKVLQDILTKHGFQVKWTSSAEEALQEKIYDYDLILLDLILPGIDGYVFAQNIKRAYPYLPIIAITSVVEEESVSRALNMGADDYIKKPFSEVELLARIKVQIRTRRLQLELLERNKELEIAYEKIKDLATKDILTGAYNRLYLREYLEMYSKGHDNNIISCFIIDIDNFKLINDTYGHLTGDVILKRLVDICKNTINDYGIVVRFGGEEFLIIITELVDSFFLAEKIRSECEKDKTGGFKWTVSIGLSQGTITKDKFLIDSEKLIKQADEMLYEAKRTGKNKAVKYKAEG
ncbi:diguanylate cyclase [Caloramator australicus]|uniref:Stage 0 sporulation protein A homolog n=1 Tax=Caloramator australicus RC3 TaxID=857293 RepID=G0V4D4_9CLOT|nr:diguanylate cyclase [Caloramator australicus]CCC57974.1 GGDEF/response regulator receiver domain protein [Caloramator australicus RC3]